MAKQKGDQAAEYVAEHYSWAEIAQAMRAIYSDILLG
jgi:hypothetical protein